jgi:hypothetical protein
MGVKFAEGKKLPGRKGESSVLLTNCVTAQAGSSTPSLKKSTVGGESGSEGKLKSMVTKLEA